MSESVQLVVFVLGQRRFAVALEHVQCVVAAAETTPVPGAPPVVLGIIDLHGEVIPVLDPRHRLQSPAPPVSPISVSDHFVIVQTSVRKIALLANQALGVIERPLSDISALGLIESGADRYHGATTLGDGLVLIHDIEKFLSVPESAALDDALEPVP